MRLLQREWHESPYIQCALKVCERVIKITAYINTIKKINALAALILIATQLD